MCDIINEKIDLLKSMREEINSYYQSLNNELSIVDKEIVDIEHYIEFFTFDAAKGYKAYKMLHDRLVKRREIKREIEKCNILWSNPLRDFEDGRSAIKQFKNTENKKYTARVLKELFE